MIVYPHLASLAKGYMFDVINSASYKARGELLACLYDVYYAAISFGADIAGFFFAKLLALVT
jgi:hypothetical protein